MKEFSMCGHPEWLRVPKPPPARTVGSCPDHNYSCPVCGFGCGQIPPCRCYQEEKRQELLRIRAEIEASGVPLKSPEELEVEIAEMRRRYL